MCLKGKRIFLTHQVIQLFCNGIANTGVAASDENSLARSRHLKSEVTFLTLNPFQDSTCSCVTTQKGRAPKSTNSDVLLLGTLVFVFINGF